MLRVWKEAKSASIYTLATMLTQLGSFLVVPLFWKQLSVSDYGTLSVTELIGSFVMFFAGLSLDLAITRFYYEWPPEQRRSRVGTLWVLSWVSSLTITAVAMIFFSICSTLLFPAVPFYPYIFQGLIGTLLIALNVIPYATIRIAHRPFLYFGYSIASFAIQLSLNVYFVAILKKGLNGLYVSNIVGGVITCIVGGLIMSRFAVPCVKMDGLQSAIKFSLHNIPASLVGGLTSIADRFLLQQFASLQVLGVYSISLKFTSLVLSLHNALKLSFVPYMVKAMGESTSESTIEFQKIRLFYLFPLFVFTMAIAFFIEDYVTYVGSAEYVPVVNWIPWLIGPVLISTFSIYLAPGLFLAKKTDKTWIPASLQLATVLGTGLLFIPSFQLLGVVASRYLSVLVLLSVNILLSQKYFPMSIPWSKVISLISVTGIAIWGSRYIEFDGLIFNLFSRGVWLVVCSISLLIIISGRTATVRFLQKRLLYQQVSTD